MIGFLQSDRVDECIPSFFVVVGMVKLFSAKGASTTTYPYEDFKVLVGV